MPEENGVGGGHFAATAPPGLSGGYFAPPVGAVPPTQDGLAARPGGPDLRSLDDVPAFVLVAATVVLLIGVAAGWTGAMALSVIHAFAGAAREAGVVGAGLPTGQVGVRGVILLLNGCANLVLAYYLVRGRSAARWAVSGVCTWWLLYWLYEVAQAQRASAQLTSTPVFGTFGQVGLTASVGMMLLAALATVTVGLLWMASSSPHFARR
jgi:hypothetical protein